MQLIFRISIVPTEKEEDTKWYLPLFGELQSVGYEYYALIRRHFIPSACWREIAPGILSTTRFTGMLLAYDRKHAVYDIGDGSMEWQVRTESSLFYTRYGSYETKADGMIRICDDDKRKQIAENIIRQTMWNRKNLLDNHYTERSKPVRYSRSPIKLRTQYERVSRQSRFCPSMQKFLVCEQSVLRLISKKLLFFPYKNKFSKRSLRFDNFLRVG